MVLNTLQRLSSGPRPSTAIAAHASFQLSVAIASRHGNPSICRRSNRSRAVLLHHLPFQAGCAGEVVCRGEVRSSNRSRWQKESITPDAADDEIGAPSTLLGNRSTMAPASTHSEPVQYSAETADFTDSKDRGTTCEQLPTTSAAAVELVSCRR